MAFRICNNVSAKDKVLVVNLNRSKLKVNDTYKKDEKTTTNFEPTSPKDFIYKRYLDTEFSKVKCHVSYIEKGNKEYKLHKDK